MDEISLEEFEMRKDVDKKIVVSMKRFEEGNEDRDRYELSMERYRRDLKWIKERDEVFREIEEIRIRKWLNRVKERDKERLVNLWIRENKKLLEVCRKKKIKVKVDYDVFIGVKILFYRGDKKIRIKWIRSNVKRFRSEIFGMKRRKVSRMSSRMILFEKFRKRVKELYGLDVVCELSDLDKEVRKMLER